MTFPLMDLSEYEQLEFIERLNDRDLLYFCSTSKQMNALCRKRGYMRKRLEGLTKVLLPYYVMNELPMIVGVFNDMQIVHTTPDYKQFLIDHPNVAIQGVKIADINKTYSFNEFMELPEGDIQNEKTGYDGFLYVVDVVEGGVVDYVIPGVYTSKSSGEKILDEQVKNLKVVSLSKVPINYAWIEGMVNEIDDDKYKLIKSVSMENDEREESDERIYA